jgi:hypothetical protein
MREKEKGRGIRRERKGERRGRKKAAVDPNDRMTHAYLYYDYHIPEIIPLCAQLLLWIARPWKEGIRFGSSLYCLK